jgi:hypothetical protein
MCSIWQPTAPADIELGHPRKPSIPPPKKKLEANSPIPFGRPNTLTIIRNKFLFPPQKKFPPSGGVRIFSEITHIEDNHPRTIFPISQSDLHRTLDAV